MKLAALTWIIAPCFVAHCALALTAGAPDLRVDARQILVPVTVTDPRGKPVTGLEQGDFSIIEANQPQPISSFFETDVNCSLGVVLDLSASMAPHLANLKRALHTLLSRAESGDEALLVRFGDYAELAGPPTVRIPSILESSSFFHAAGNTALYDAIALAIREIQGRSLPRRAIVVLSDGVDTSSRQTRQDLIRLAQESGVEIHTLAFTIETSGKRSLAEWRERQNGITFLNEVSEATGGMSFAVRDSNSMDTTADKLARALHNQYVIGFRPGADPDGKHHHFRIRVDLPGGQVHARQQYLSD